jgi:hypothetical protein
LKFGRALTVYGLWSDEPSKLVIRDLRLDRLAALAMAGEIKSEEVPKQLK